jgi:SAM-dependent methyltransferase
MLPISTDHLHTAGLSKLYSDCKPNPFKSDDFPAINKDFYPYITAPGLAEVQIRYAYNWFESIHGTPPKTFIDLGCGLGAVLLVAHSLGLEATGVELNQDYIEQAREIFNKIIITDSDKIKLEQGNILEWIPDQQYDIMYWWTPIFNSDLRDQFHRHILSHCKPGQLIVSRNVYDLYGTDMKGNRYPVEILSEEDMVKLGGVNGDNYYQTVIHPTYSPLKVTS